MEFFGRPVATGRVVAVLAVLSVVGLAAGYGFATRAKPRPVTVAAEDGGSSSKAPALSFYVHVAGAVHEPGLYRLPETARVDDAVRAAGGPTADADLDALNLAARLRDGDKVVVPVRGGGGAAETDTDASGRINLNSADASTLEDLPGIGPALAERIIAYREQHGGFRTVRDLLRVSGIGPAKFEQLEPLVTV